MSKTNINWFHGKKTYIISSVTILWALIGAFAGWLEWDVAGQMITTALMASGIRHGVSNS